MEYIKNIEIKNFKSIRHQIVDGCKRINVFIGYPNVGKSNLLEALSLFCPDPGIRFTDLVRIKDIPTLFFNGFVNNAIEITLNDYFQLSCNYMYDELHITEKELTEHGGGRFITIKSDRYKKLAYNGGEIKGATSRKEFKKYEFQKKCVFRTTHYSHLEMPFGKNIFNIIRTNEALYKEVTPLLKDYDLEFLYDQSLQTFRILKRITDQEIFTVPYELLADTLQRLIFFKAAILSNKETVLLLEEPEAHMFPPYIRKFTSDVIFDKTNQFFIATHSPYVLDTFMEDAPNDLSIYLVYYEDGETKLKLMQQEDIDEVREYGVDLFFNLESYLKHGKINNA